MTENNFTLCFYGVTVKGTARRYGHTTFYYLDETNGEAIPCEDPIQGMVLLRKYCKHYSIAKNHSQAIYNAMRECYLEQCNN